MASSPAKLETRLSPAGPHGDTAGDAVARGINKAPLLAGSRTGAAQLQLACLPACVQIAQQVRLQTETIISDDSFLVNVLYNTEKLIHSLLNADD